MSTDIDSQVKRNTISDEIQRTDKYFSELKTSVEAIISKIEPILSTSAPRKEFPKTSQSSSMLMNCIANLNEKIKEFTETVNEIVSRIEL